MHPNPAFHSATREDNIAFARARGFGVLAVGVEGAPLLSHLPFSLSPDGMTAELHLVRSNPIARALTGPLPARLAVAGPDGYVSPDWYGLADQVPTWNYVAVHLAGRLEPLPQSALRGLLDRLSARFEAQLAPKPQWTADKMDPQALTRMMRMIQPCQLVIEEVAGTWKLSQNKPDPARAAAADHMADSIGAELAALAALMRDA